VDIEYTINNSSDAIDKIITFISSNGLKTIKQKTQLSDGSLQNRYICICYYELAE
jgi:hypothetical protein